MIHETHDFTLGDRTTMIVNDDYDLLEEAVTIMKHTLWHWNECSKLVNSPDDKDAPECPVCASPIVNGSGHESDCPYAMMARFVTAREAI